MARVEPFKSSKTFKSNIKFNVKDGFQFEKSSTESNFTCIALKGKTCLFLGKYFTDSSLYILKVIFFSIKFQLKSKMTTIAEQRFVEEIAE